MLTLGDHYYSGAGRAVCPGSGPSRAGRLERRRPGGNRASRHQHRDTWKENALTVAPEDCPGAFASEGTAAGGKDSQRNIELGFLAGA